MGFMGFAIDGVDPYYISQFLHMCAGLLMGLAGIRVARRILAALVPAAEPQVAGLGAHRGAKQRPHAA